MTPVFPSSTGMRDLFRRSQTRFSQRRGTSMSSFPEVLWRSENGKEGRGKGLKLGSDDGNFCCFGYSISYEGDGLMMSATNDQLCEHLSPSTSSYNICQ